MFGLEIGFDAPWYLLLLLLLPVLWLFSFKSLAGTGKLQTFLRALLSHDRAGLDRHVSG